MNSKPPLPVYTTDLEVTMTKKIDARLLAPGQLFIDPFGHVEHTPLRTLEVHTHNTFPHADGSAVPTVRLVGLRQDDGHTEIERVLDLGTEVEIVPNQPDIYVSFDVATRTWTILIDTMASADKPGQLNLNVALNDATLFDGDPEAPIKPEPPQEGDRVRLSGRTAILHLDVNGFTGTVMRVYGHGTASVTLDQESRDGLLYVEIALDQLTKIT